MTDRQEEGRIVPVSPEACREFQVQMGRKPLPLLAGEKGHSSAEPETNGLQKRPVNGTVTDAAEVDGGQGCIARRFLCLHAGHTYI